MIRCNNISRPVHDPLRTPTFPSPKSRGSHPNPQDWRLWRRLCKLMHVRICKTEFLVLLHVYACLELEAQAPKCRCRDIPPVRNSFPSVPCYPFVPFCNWSLNAIKTFVRTTRQSTLLLILERNNNNSPSQFVCHNLVKLLFVHFKLSSLTTELWRGAI